MVPTVHHVKSLEKVVSVNMEVSSVGPTAVLLIAFSDAFCFSGQPCFMEQPLTKRRGVTVLLGKTRRESENVAFA